MNLSTNGICLQIAMKLLVIHPYHLAKVKREQPLPLGLQKVKLKVTAATLGLHNLHWSGNTKRAQIDFCFLYLLVWLLKTTA